SPDDRQLLSGHRPDSTVRTWQFADKHGAIQTLAEPVRVRKLSETGITGMALSPGGLTAAFAERPFQASRSRRGQTIPPRDVTSPLLERRGFEGHRGSDLRNMVFSPDGNRFASASAWPGDAGVRIWDVATCKELCFIAAEGERMAFSPDGRTLAACGPRAEPT